MADNGNSKLLPPYITFASLLHFIDSLKRGIPGQVDRSLMKTMSGSMQAQMMSALKYLHMVDANGNEDTLTRLVNSEGPERTSTLQDVLKTSYPFLFNGFDLTRATSSQFRQKFTEVGATGDSVRKCISFFLNAAKEAEIEVSPYITETVRQQGTHSQVGESRQKKIPFKGTGAVKSAPSSHKEPSVQASSVSWEQMLLAKFPSFDPAWPDEVKKEWFTAFHQMMKLGKTDTPTEEENTQADSVDED